MSNRLCLVLNGVRVDVTLPDDAIPEHIGAAADRYATMLAKGYTFDAGGGVHPPKQVNP